MRNLSQSFRVCLVRHSESLKELFLTFSNNLYKCTLNIKLHVDKRHTMYAAVVSSGNSPFAPRWAMLYGRDVCRDCLSESCNLLGSGLPTHPPIVSRIRKGTRTKPVKCTTSMFKIIFFKLKENFSLDYFNQFQNKRNKIETKQCD